MTPAPDDIPALESWLRDEALEAHRDEMMYPAGTSFSNKSKHKKEAFNEVIAKIQSMRVSQRPHVQGRI